MNLVTMRDVSVAYDGYEAIQHVDLEIGDDDFLGVIGPNGGGKTTLVKAILGTVPHTGEICLAPELFRGKERLIGYMPQLSDFDREFPISVLEVVLSGLQGRRGFRSPYTREDREKAMALLASSGIAETARQPIGEVSGGQMQRVLLALALEPLPHILVLDEPLSGVDIDGEKQLLDMLDEIRTRYDLSILLSTHDFATLGQFADKVILLKGTVLRVGPPDEVLASPEFQEVFHLNLGKGNLGKGGRG